MQHSFSRLQARWNKWSQCERLNLRLNLHQPPGVLTLDESMHLFLYVRRPKPLPLQPSEVSRDRWIGVSTFYNRRKDEQDAMEHPGICGIWISWEAPLSDSSMHTHFSLYLSMYFWSLLSSPALWHAWTSRSSPVQGCMPMKTFTPPRGYGLGAHLPSFSCNIRTKSVAMLTSSGLVKAWGAWCSQRHVIDWQQFHCGCTNWNLDSSVHWSLSLRHHGHQVWIPRPQGNQWVFRCTEFFHCISAVPCTKISTVAMRILCVHANYI